MRRFIITGALASILMLIGTTAEASTWNVPKDFATIQEAIDSDAVQDGDTILVKKGNHAGAFLTKSVEIKGQGGAVISGGPVHSSGLVQGFRLLAGSDGTVISQLTFTVDLAIMNGSAVDDVTVEHCAFYNTIQAVSNWGGSGWLITQNVIQDLRTRNGGGIGVLVAERSGGVVQDNIVSHNTITGTLQVWEDDGGGYDGSGIVLYADFRWGMPGAAEISNNGVVHNKVSLVSDTPDVVNVNAFELTDTRNDPDVEPVIFDNAIGFNDFRGTESQLLIIPGELQDYNEISRNLGDNRGHGSHPGAFGPGGH